MLQREPKPGDRIEYKVDGGWIEHGRPVHHVEGNIVYYGPDKDDVGFIWRFHDGLNTMHRIKED